ncbi:hypothetical protein V6N11_061217 [Hibiscus sabdariffa]|uniref:Reverse transcriptase zinc-binding domain-containing protein n=1 Tax=Hibiscus sabdariffa TaxID=183260 RepID=A0ABR2NV91_9ROSI
MENPTALDPFIVALTLAAHGLAEGNHGGRPPDNSMCVDSPTSLEGPRSVHCVDGQSTNKKDNDLNISASDIHMGNDALEQSRVMSGVALPDTGHRVGVDSVGVSNRKRRNGFPRKVFGTGDADTGRNVGLRSRFASLGDASLSVDHLEVSAPKSPDRQMDTTLLATKNTLVGNGRTSGSEHGVREVYVGDGSDDNALAQKSEGGSLLKGQLAENSRKVSEGNSESQEVPVRVASQGRVVVAKSSLIAEKNTTVQKKRDAQTSSTPTLAAGLSNLMEDLTNAEELENSRLGVSSSKGVGEASGNWDWPYLSPILPPEIRDLIAAVQPPQMWLGADSPEWRWTDSRHFTTSSAYSYLSDTDSTPTDTIWKKVWTLPIPQRVKTFMWITLHGRHLTNAERFRRHLTSSAVCAICGFHMEDMSHILRNCVAARGLWTRVLHPDLLVDFFHTPFNGWLQRNLGCTAISVYGDQWESRFAIYCWLLWKDRCSAILDSYHTPREDVLSRGARLMHECVRVLHTRLHNSTPKSMQSMKLSRPAPGWVKGNVDASVNTTNGQVAIGGINQEEHGVWIQTSHSLSGNGLVASIRYWIDHNWELVIRHIPRTCNILADKLADWGRLNSQEVGTLANPPLSMVVDVETDKSSLQTVPLVLQDWFGRVDVVCFNSQVDPGG